MEEQRNLALGNPGDVDFIGLVSRWREENGVSTNNSPRLAEVDHSISTSHPKICICVRKRPVSDKERRKLDHDSVTCVPERNLVCIHQAKFRVDGITKYCDHNSFCFDYTFNENSSTEDLYQQTTMPLVDFILSGKGGRATGKEKYAFFIFLYYISRQTLCRSWNKLTFLPLFTWHWSIVFAYGQTGSGKTYTMNGIQKMVVEDLFMLMEGADDEAEDDCVCLSKTRVTVSFFELYGGRVQDLLNNRNKLKILEDGRGEVVVSGLEEFEAHDAGQLLDLIDTGNSFRTTHATEANDTSSRSHAVCQIHLRSSTTDRLYGKLSLVDLAGSERGSDTKSNNRQRRTESADINKSLLTLKECIRALDTSSKTGNSSTHVPYRGSKLTMVLKDCFTSNLAKTTMIATVSPGSSSADHTINSLRYAHRIKEKKVISSPKPTRSKVRSVSPLPTTSNTENRNRQVTRTPPPKSTRKGLSPCRSGTKSCKSPQRTQLQSPARRTQTKSPLRQITPSAGTTRRTKIPGLSPRISRKEIATPPAMPDEVAYTQTVENLYEEEENLLNLHMTILRNDAELIQEEVALLNKAQSGGDDYDIDSYVLRLEEIIVHKEKCVGQLKEKLQSFRECLRQEEILSRNLKSSATF